MCSSHRFTISCYLLHKKTTTFFVTHFGKHSHGWILNVLGFPNNKAVLSYFKNGCRLDLVLHIVSRIGGNCPEILLWWHGLKLLSSLRYDVPILFLGWSKLVMWTMPVRVRKVDLSKAFCSTSIWDIILITTIYIIIMRQIIVFDWMLMAQHIYKSYSSYFYYFYII